MGWVVHNRSVASLAGRIIVGVVVALTACSQTDSAEPKLDFGVSLAVASDGTVYLADRADSSILALGQPMRVVLEDPLWDP